MKHVTATVEIDMGVYDDDISADFNADKFCEILCATNRKLMVETALQFVVKDIDTGLITNITHIKKELA